MRHPVTANIFEDVIENLQQMPCATCVTPETLQPWIFFFLKICKEHRNRSPVQPA